jgi:hypothetical protein
VSAVTAMRLRAIRSTRPDACRQVTTRFNPPPGTLKSGRSPYSAARWLNSCPKVKSDLSIKPRIREAQASVVPASRNRHNNVLLRSTSSSCQAVARATASSVPEPSSSRLLTQSSASRSSAPRSRWASIGSPKRRSASSSTIIAICSGVAPAGIRETRWRAASSGGKLRRSSRTAPGTGFGSSSMSRDDTRNGIRGGRRFSHRVEREEGRIDAAGPPRFSGFRRKS